MSEKTKQPRGGGRPTKYRQSVARAICIRLSLGQSLNEICRHDKYPSKVTVFAWLHKHPEFLNQYQRAREDQQQHHLDEMLEIADDASNDWMERHDRDGEVIGWQVNGDHVNRSRLRIDTRKWIMERMAPKSFGNKQTIEHTGDITPITGIEVTIVGTKTKD